MTAVPNFTYTENLIDEAKRELERERLMDDNTTGVLVLLILMAGYAFIAWVVGRSLR